MFAVHFATKYMLKCNKKLCHLHLNSCKISAKKHYHTLGSTLKLHLIKYDFDFQKKHNVHMYYDKATGTWVRLPIGWELHHPMAKALVDQVEVQ